MKIPLKYVVALVFLLLTGFFIYNGISTHKSNKRLSTALKTVKDTVKFYNLKLNGVNQTVFEQSNLILTQKEAIAAGLVERKRLKKLHIKYLKANAKLSGTIKVLKDSLKIDRTRIVYVDTVKKIPYLKLPTSLNYADQYVDFKVNLKRDASWKFDLRVPLNLEVSLADKIAVTTPNPYVHINSIKSVSIPAKEKFMDRKAVKWGIRGLFFAGGFWLGSK